VAAVDRGFGGWRRAAADTVAVCGRPRRGAAGGCLGRRRQIVGIASAPAAAVGCCWLALMLWRELQLDQFWSKRLGVSGKEPALAKAGGRIGIRCCSCWSPTAGWRRAANGACIVSGFSAARWPTGWVKMPGWWKSTSCTAVTTGCWCTSKRSSIIWWNGAVRRVVGIEGGVVSG